MGFFIALGEESRGHVPENFWTGGARQRSLWMERVGSGFSAVVSAAWHDEKAGSAFCVLAGEPYGSDMVLAAAKSHDLYPRALFRELRAGRMPLPEGSYAGVLFDPRNNEILCVTDRLGKKRIFLAASGKHRYLVTELKMLDAFDWFKKVPAGLCSFSDIASGEFSQIPLKNSPGGHGDIVDLLEKATLDALPSKSERLGVFLSGGLDSSVIAALLSRQGAEAIHFVLGDNDSPDVASAEAVAGELRLKNVCRVSLPKARLIPELVSRVVHATESFNPSIISNGVATLLLCEAARREGVQVVFGGEGADELFGGYHTFDESDSWKKTRDELIADLWFTELRRLDYISSGVGISFRYPFLDSRVLNFSEGLSYSDFYDGRGGQNKIVLRNGFSKILPDRILWRKKTSLDVGSGIRRMVFEYLTADGKSEKDALRLLWRNIFRFDERDPYFYSYPVFEKAISCRGGVHR